MSPAQRAEAGLPSLDELSPNRPIKSPSPSPRGRGHAEEDLLSRVADHIDNSGLTSSDMAGRSVSIHVSQRVCNTCRQGFGTTADPGVLRRFSERYPELTLRITNSETSEILLIQNGKRVK
jgi:hypothetical protein